MTLVSEVGEQTADPTRLHQGVLELGIMDVVWDQRMMLEWRLD